MQEVYPYKFLSDKRQLFICQKRKQATASNEMMREAFNIRLVLGAMSA